MTTKKLAVMALGLAGVGIFNWGCWNADEWESAEQSPVVAGSGGSSAGGSNGCGLPGVGGRSGSGTCTACVTAIRDATIAMATPNTKLGSSPECVVGGGTETSCLVQFNLPDIPASATVTAANLRLDVFQEAVDTFPIYQVKVQWNQANATWNKYTSSLAWGLPGAKAASDRGSAVLGEVPAVLGPRTVALNATGQALVQSWVRDPSLNHGMIIAKATATGSAKFRSIEAPRPALPPSLCVSWR